MLGRTGLICLCLLAGSAFATPRDAVLQHIVEAKKSPEAIFKQWVLEHAKEYLQDAQEYARRFRIWSENLDFVESYNRKHSSHWLGLNVHADKTHEEFKEHTFGFNYAEARARESLLKATPFRYADVDESTLPKAIDWRKKGAVSHVKNQAQCGSCWAFSTTGSVEGANAIHTGKLEVLSEQMLVDCDTAHDHGCNGGLMDYAFQFIIDNGGIDTERDYPYTGEDGICDARRRDRHVVTIDSYEDVPRNNERALWRAVAHQPVSVAIQANERPFQLYAGGVFDEECGTQLDHGVLVVGYGHENGTDYWLVKNSWGAAWGDQGYIKLARTLQAGPGKCGIAMLPSYPVKEHDNPPRPPRPAPEPPTPPPPSPEPVACDAVSECQAGTTCCCVQNLLSYCLQWACCPIPEATCCDDHVHCCPKQLPVCDVEHGRCLPHSVSGDALWDAIESAPISMKVPANRFKRTAASIIQQVL